MPPTAGMIYRRKKKKKKEVFSNTEAGLIFLFAALFWRFRGLFLRPCAEAAAAAVTCVGFIRRGPSAGGRSARKQPRIAINSPKNGDSLGGKSQSRLRRFSLRKKLTKLLNFFFF